MKTHASDLLGTESVGKLLVRQSVPAAVGILVMSLNIVVDTIFVGNWIGSVGIAAINVVLPISFFISALGMAIGIGGASIISRALGSSDKTRALKTFGNQILLTLLLTTLMAGAGIIFSEKLIPAFGGKGAIFDYARTYYMIILYGVPLLALNMMGNNVIRAEGKPRFAMVVMIISSVTNLFLDYVFIFEFGWGMAGAAWATFISYAMGLVYIVYFFLSKNSELKINRSHLRLNLLILKEMAALGLVTLARQAIVSVTYLLMNNILFNFGGESSVAAYGIIGRMLMFALFPVLGITQGFLPIAGFNYGADKFERVKESIYKAIAYAGVLALLVFSVIMIFPELIITVFTDEPEILSTTPKYMRYVFAATPIVAVQLIGSAYFQAVGKALPALLLTLTRQGLFFIPLLFILPSYLGEMGVWISFPAADILATLVTAFFLNREIKTKLNSEIVPE